jgi:hypothetical protein
MALHLPSFSRTSGAVALIAAGWVLFSRRRCADGAPRQVPERLRWRPARVALLVVSGMWAIWYAKINTMGPWLDKDEAERLRSPAWRYHFDDFTAGISMAAVQQHLSREGFRMRCYGNLRPDEKIDPKVTHACWTIANNAHGIPSRAIFFAFGKDGLRYIRMDFPREQWPAVREWIQGQEGMPAGTFGSDQSGNPVLGRRGATGLVWTADPGSTGWAMVLWQPRTQVMKESCLTDRFTLPQRKMLCMDWPAPPPSTRFTER